MLGKSKGSPNSLLPITRYASDTCIMRSLVLNSTRTHISRPSTHAITNLSERRNGFFTPFTTIKDLSLPSLTAIAPIKRERVNRCNINNLKQYDTENISFQHHLSILLTCFRDISVPIAFSAVFSFCGSREQDYQFTPSRKSK